MFEPRRLADLQTQATARWHEAASDPLPTQNLDARATVEALVLEQHRANFDLWHREDEARDPLAGDTVIAAVKRDIDRLNQHRNDLVERLDALLAAASDQNAAAPLHSETPGLIVDRLSILALKIFHTEEQIRRPGTDESHRDRNGARLRVLVEQRYDLVACLIQLWAEVGAGTRRFKVYRQMKMYNDPTLNPVLYRSKTQRSQG